MTMISRAEWGAAPAKADCVVNRDPHQIVRAIVHYSDTVPDEFESPATDPGEHDAAATVRAIQKFHIESKGWCDIAYHRLIAADGSVFEGRTLGQVGAHAAGANSDSVGYCLLTNGPITDEQQRALVEQMHADRAPLGLPYAIVQSHRDVSATLCPGDEIAEWVAAGLPVSDAPLPGPTPEPGDCRDLAPGPAPEGHLVLKEGDQGAEVIHLQALLADHGHAPAKSKKKGGGWDGVFGPNTTEAVKQLQAEHQLVVDGKVGRQTWCALGIR